MLKEFINSINFHEIEPDRNFFHPISDRKYWDAFAKKHMDEIVKHYETITSVPRRELTATLYLDYRRTGNRTRYQEARERRMKELLYATLLECCRNDGALIDDIVDLTWMVLEQTTWCVPAHNTVVPIADGLPYHKKWSVTICSTHTAMHMAFVYQVMGEKLDEISKMITLRIKEVIREKVLNEILERDDYWWLGLGGRKPNNIGIDCWETSLLAALITVDDMDFLRKYILKSLICIDQYIDNQGEEGGCNEGPSYWFASHGKTIEALEVLNKATGGAFSDCYLTDKIRNMAQFMMKTHVGKEYFVNFADGPSRVDYGALFVFRAGKILNLPEVCNFAAQWGKASGQALAISGGMDMYREMENIKYYDEYMSFIPKENNESEYYLSDLDVMTVRTQSKNGEIFLAAKAGHNGESHNHNDVGNFIVYKNIIPFIVDCGHLVYNSKTFSSERYTIWANRSEYHNVPVIDGCQQSHSVGKKGKNAGYRSENVTYTKGEKASTLSMSIKRAYENYESINDFNRDISIDKEEGIVTVTDTFDLGKEAPVIWNFLTHKKPEWDGEKITLCAENGETLALTPSGAKFSFVSEVIECDDARFRHNWGERLYRAQLKTKLESGKVVFEIK